MGAGATGDRWSCSQAHGPRQGPRWGAPGGVPGCADPPRPPGHRKKQASFLSLPTSTASRIRKEQNGKCLRHSVPWVDERKEGAHLYPTPRPRHVWARPQCPGPAAAGLTLQRECVRCRGELMSLGVDDRSPSAAEASEMTEGCREWQGLTLTAGKQRRQVSGRHGRDHLMHPL